MSTLYELTGDFLELLDMLEDTDIDEQVIVDTLEGIEYEIEVKADGYAKLIKSLEGTVDATKKEIDRLTTRKKTFENRIKYLKDNLYQSMKVTGKTKFTTDLFSFNIAKNGGRRKLIINVDVDKIPEEYRIKQPDKVDGDKLRELIKEEGVEGQDGSIHCDYAYLAPQGESLRIR